MSTTLTLVVDNTRATSRRGPGSATRGTEFAPSVSPAFRSSLSSVRRADRHLRIAGLRRRFFPQRLAGLRGDRGAVTAEYAIVIMAAVAFAGLLVAIMRSGEIRAVLVDLVQSALGVAG